MTYITHADVEKALWVTFSSQGKPPLDSDIDNLCTQVEGEVAGRIYPFTLADANGNDSDALKALLVEMVLIRMMRADKWQRARGATSSLEGAQFPETVRTDNEVIAAIRRLAVGVEGWDTAKLVKSDDYD